MELEYQLLYRYSLLFSSNQVPRYDLERLSLLPSYRMIHSDQDGYSGVGCRSCRSRRALLLEVLMNILSPPERCGSLEAAQR